MPTSYLAADHGLCLENEASAMALLSSGLAACIFTEQDLSAEFFDLKNCVAGNVFQKLTNYHFPIAIVLPADHNHGDRVSELALEHRAHPLIRFFETTHEANDWIQTRV